MVDQKIKNKTTATLKLHAKALGLPIGSAEIFAKKSIDAAEKSLKHQPIVEEQDFIRLVAKELSKYNSDLAYVYKMYDKII